MVKKKKKSKYNKKIKKKPINIIHNVNRIKEKKKHNPSIKNIQRARHGGE